MDFAHWENRYDRRLSEQEKQEIKRNFSGFFGVLEEIYQENPEYHKGWLDGLLQGRTEMIKKILADQNC